MMNAMQIAVVRLALENMFREGHFSICTIDQILRVTGGIPDGRDYETLRLLHCVKFRDMPQNVRIELPRLIQKVVESVPMSCEVWGERVVALPPAGEGMKMVES